MVDNFLKTYKFATAMKLKSDYFDKEALIVSFWCSHGN